MKKKTDLFGLLRYLAIKIAPKGIRYKLWKVFIKYSSIFYFGKGVKCPVCNSEYRDFAPYIGRDLMIGQVCFNCESFPRHRFMSIFLDEKIELDKKNIKMLHVAPEECLQNKFKKTNIEYLGIDLDTNTNIAEHKSDLTNLEFEDNFFDFIICSHVLEHIEEDRKAIGEIHRVLKKGGKAMVLVPMVDQDKTFEDPSIRSYADRLEHYHQGDHVRLYGNDFPDRLVEKGFVVEGFKYSDLLSKDLITKYKLVDNDIIFTCTK